MRLLDDHSTVPVRNRHDDAGPNVSMYVSEPGVDDPTQIRYRDVQLINEGQGSLAYLPIGDWDPGGDYFIPERGVGIVACTAEQIVVSLGAAYTSVTFWAQLRVSSNGIENDTVYRPERITVDVSQDSSDTIDGVVHIIGVDKRDAGGLRVRFVWIPAISGIQPTQFRLTPTGGPTTPADVSVVRSDVFVFYELELSSLTDTGAYTFDLIAENGAVTLTADAISFTADAAGPAAVDSLTSEAC